MCPDTLQQFGCSQWLRIVRSPLVVISRLIVHETQMPVLLHDRYFLRKTSVYQNDMILFPVADLIYFHQQNP